MSKFKRGNEWGKQTKAADHGTMQLRLFDAILPAAKMRRARKFPALQGDRNKNFSEALYADCRCNP